MEKQQPACEIIYVEQKSRSGWRWRAVSAAGAERSSDQVYGLFYECVIDARTHGYRPEGVLSSEPLPAGRGRP